jgi:hypothetical protein
VAQNEVAVFLDPEIDPQFAIAQGHGVGGVLAGCVPDDIVGRDRVEVVALHDGGCGK